MNTHRDGRTGVEWLPLWRVRQTAVGAATICALFGCGETTTEVVQPERLEAAASLNLTGPVGGRSVDPITVRVFGQGDVPIEGVRVLFAVTDGDALVEEDVVTTDANGVAFTFVTFGMTAGEVRATATVQGLTGSPVVFMLTALPADAAQLEVADGSGQTGTAGTGLANPLVVRVADEFGNSVPGAVVLFTTPGDGSVDPDRTTADAEGLGRTSWTLGTVAGEQQVTVTLDPPSNATATFTATALADAAASLSADAGDGQGGVAGQSLTDALVVHVADQHGNPVVDQPVHFELTAGDGSVAPTDATTDIMGNASTTLTLGTTREHVVEATAGMLAPVSFHAKSFPQTTLEPITTSITAVDLAWSGVDGAEFERFELRRSQSSPVTDEDHLVTTISDPAATTFSDNTVQVGQRYFYRVFVHYQGGFQLVTNEETVDAGVSVELGGNGFDMALDVTADRLYVSVPSLNEIVVISTNTFEVVDNIIVGSRPHGIDLGENAGHLFVALNGAGSVAALDLTDNSVEEILIENELGDSRAYDVLNPIADVVVATASPSSSGFAYVVRIDLDFANGHAAGRIASNRIIRATPVLGAGPSGDFVYVGEGFSPNSLYKLDMTTAGNPIVLEDNHGAVSGTTVFDVSPDGSRIYLRSGQVLRSGSFNLAGTLPTFGVPLVNGDGSLVYLGKDGAVEMFNTTTFLQVGSTPITGSADRLILIDGETALLVLVDDVVYGVPVP